MVNENPYCPYCGLPMEVDSGRARCEKCAYSIPSTVAEREDLEELTIIPEPNAVLIAEELEELGDAPPG